jgi:hypothetical protein
MFIFGRTFTAMWDFGKNLLQMYEKSKKKDD